MPKSGIHELGSDEDQEQQKIPRVVTMGNGGYYVGVSWERQKSIFNISCDTPSTS